MAYCKNCGASIPDIAKFCPKCGIQDPISSAVQRDEEPTVTEAPLPHVGAKDTSVETPKPEVQEQTAPAQQHGNVPPQPSKPLDYTWFNEHFILLFVIVGVTAYALSQLAGMFVTISVVFGVLLGVFAIIFALSTMAVAIVRMVASARDDANTRKKYSLRDNICLAVGIIEFVFIMLLCIYIFIVGDRLSGVL